MRYVNCVTRMYHILYSETIMPFIYCGYLNAQQYQQQVHVVPGRLVLFSPMCCVPLFYGARTKESGAHAVTQV